MILASIFLVIVGVALVALGLYALHPFALVVALGLACVAIGVGIAQEAN